MGTPHPVNKKLEMHNTWLVSFTFHSQGPLTDVEKADGLKYYIDWAANQGFGIIDVNVPQYLTDPDVRILLDQP